MNRALDCAANRPILQRSFGEQDDLNIMMEFRFGGSKPSAFTTAHSMTLYLDERRAKLYQLFSFRFHYLLVNQYLVPALFPLFSRRDRSQLSDPLAIATRTRRGN